MPSAPVYEVAHANSDVRDLVLCVVTEGAELDQSAGECHP